MRGDGYDRCRASGGAVVPKNPVGGGGLLLGVRLKDFLAFWPFQRSEFVSLETVMLGIRCQEVESLFDSFITFLVGRTNLELSVI